MRDKDTIIGCLAAVGCEFLYGISYLFTKNAADVGGVLALLGWRFLVAFLVMAVLVLTGTVKINLKGRSLRPLLVVALFCPCIYFLGETVGIRYTAASESGVFLACIPVVSLIMSSLILKKKPSRIQVAGILITLSGVLITVLAVGTSSSLSPVGYGFLVIGVLSYSLYSVFVDKAAGNGGQNAERENTAAAVSGNSGTGFSDAEITYVMLAAGAAFYIILALVSAIAGGNVPELVTLPFRSRTFLAAILYQGIGCSVAAFSLSNLSIAKIGVNRNASFVGISTVVSIIAGALVLGESFTLMQGIGAAVIIAGVYIANSRKKRTE